MQQYVVTAAARARHAGGRLNRKLANKLADAIRSQLAVHQDVQLLDATAVRASSESVMAAATAAAAVCCFLCQITAVSTLLSLDYAPAKVICWLPGKVVGVNVAQLLQTPPEARQ